MKNKKQIILRIIQNNIMLNINLYKCLNKKKKIKTLVLNNHQNEFKFK